ncbi:MAG: glycine--tRNA ligase [Candidatus Nanohaloarchaeota archaeon QJJ-9]|nr:glycine--tRNA ligase [Candidatus Nanohaloarchaeota archaeon QJJ-9]
MPEEYDEELLSHLVQNGFIWGPEPEVYNGLAGFYTYGPMGKLLKNKVEGVIRDVFKEYHFYEVEAPVILPKEVWKASGHLESFVDPMVVCSDCEKTFRADNLVEDNTEIEAADGLSDEKLLREIDENDIKCPSCGSEFEDRIEDFNLMMETSVAGRESYNRPETATTTYLPFKRYWRFFRKKFPIKVFQIGEAFRNEISPRQHVLRGREFTQAEGQIFLPPEMKNDWPQYEDVKDEELPFWSAEMQEDEDDWESLTLEEAQERGYIGSDAYSWSVFVAYNLFTSVGIPKERIRLREHKEDEKAHYAKEAWDVEIKTDSFGWTEVCGVHDRTDYDLSRHQEYSNESFVVRDSDNNKVVPHVLEIAFGTDRPVFSLLDIFFDEKEGKLEVPNHVAPLDAAVFPLVNKDDLPEVGEEIFRQLHDRKFDVEYDDTGSIGKRYARNDAKGTAVCITVDFDTLDDDTVTMRDRDSEEQVRVDISELGDRLEEWLYTDVEFEGLGKPVE